MISTDPELAAAWDALRAALPTGWVVGRPSHRSDERRWLLYAYDPLERPKVGKRTSEMQATAATELEVVQGDRGR